MSNFTYSDDELAHYGVLGMKWGVRKDPREAYSKSVKQLKKYQQKAAKNKAKASDRLKYKAARAEKRATRFKRKAAKVQRKATRLILPMNADKAARKIAKYNLKAARAENRAARRIKRYEKFKMREAKYDKKTEKFAKAIENTFKDIPVSSLNSADVEYMREYERSRDVQAQVNNLNKLVSR